MGDFITALTAGITPATLWGALTAAAGIIITAVIFSFGYHVVKKALKGLGKGKTNA